MPLYPMNVNRRQFLRRAATVTVGGGGLVGYYTWRIEPHWVEIIERDLPLRGLPSRLEGKTLVQISDLHVGPTVDPNYLRRAVEQAASLNPDLVAITGDLMTCRHGEQIERTVELVRLLKPKRAPVFVIPGNHDYGIHYSELHVGDELMRQLRGIGAISLQNELTDYEGLQIVGLDELWARRFDPATPLVDFDLGRDGIALPHNPDTVDRPGWAGFAGWVLAGHTHGGQCRAPFIGAPVVPIHNKRYTAGEVVLENGLRLYVNRGLGYSKPVRFLCPPEITRFRLTLAT
ncbi:MAG: metallophosphoesterase [Aeoliella sp.]